MFNALSALSPLLQQWFEIHGDSINIDAGQELIQEGLHPEYLFFLIEGQASVTTFQGSQSVELARLEPGAIFGEMSFIEARPPVATIKTLTRAQVLRIKRTTISEELQTNPTISRDFYMLIAMKLASQLISQNQFIHRWPGVEIEPIRKVLIVFSILTEVDVEWLSKRGKKISFAPGDLIIKQSSSVPSFLIILAGDASVSIIQKGADTVVGSSRRGEFLGELTLLGSSATATASVKAITDMEILEIDKQTLDDEFQNNQKFASRFFNALAVLLSQRLRDQLRSRGMATRAFAAESLDDESMTLEQMSSITTAGQRFEWLCQNVL